MITEDQVTTALRSFILSVIPTGLEVIVGQDNRVPEPISPNFISMIQSGRNRLATNENSWDTVTPPVAWVAKASTAVVVQLDVHGPDAADNAEILALWFRDDYACQQMGTSGVQPLYASDPIQMPYHNGEGQYESRWTMNVTMQINPVVSTPAQFADNVVVTIEPPVGNLP